MTHFFHNGLRLFYRMEGTGPLPLILPGNTASSACHPAELAYFGQRYLAISLDLPGTGRSDRLALWPVDCRMNLNGRAKIFPHYYALGYFVRRNDIDYGGNHD